MSYRAPLDEMRRTMSGFEDSDYPEGEAGHKYEDTDGDVGTQLQVICNPIHSSLFVLSILFLCHSFPIILFYHFISFAFIHSFTFIFYFLFFQLTYFRTTLKTTMLTVADVIPMIKTMNQVAMKVSPSILEVTRALKKAKEVRRTDPLPLPLPLLLFCPRHQIELEL